MMPVAVTLPDHPTLLESLVFQFVGLVIVTIALVGIWLMLELLGAAFRKAARQRHTQSDGGTAPEITQTPPPELIAVIAAAIDSSVAGPHRIVSVKPVNELQHADPNLLAWSGEGRRQIFSSHTPH